MVVDDAQFMDMFRGQRVKLTLRTSSYFGVVQRINADRTLVLADVVCGGRKVPGSKLFFGREVLNVEFASDGDAGSGSVALRVRAGCSGFGRAVTPPVLRRNVGGRSDVDRLGDDREDYINFIVIDEFHEKFKPAVMHIKKQHVIGVGAEGVDALKQGRLCWLQIATKNKVYLFDILLLGARAFKNGLSMILQNKHILKVIHDCRVIAGCLITQFGVKLTNVFDTQVADVMFFYSETGGFLPNRVSTLQEVMSLHLKVSSSQLLFLQEEKEMWYKRPCPLPLLKVMALSVIHLQPLRLVLMDSLMTDYMALVDSYLNSSYYEPDKLEYMSMENILELPRELRQLEQVHRKRQEWAADHYPITKQGLLDRFNLRTRTPLQTPPGTEDQGQCHTQPQADSGQPTPMESLPSTQVDLLHQPPVSPLKSSNVSAASSVDIPALRDLPAQVSELEKQVFPVSNLDIGAGGGCIEVLMDTVGRESAYGNDKSTFSPLPAMGRGFLLQMPPAHITQERPGNVKTPERLETALSCPSPTPSQEFMPQPATGAIDLPKNTSSLRGGQSLKSFLSQSFQSFRY